MVDEVDGHGDVTESHVAWKLDKSVPFLPSPSCVGDLIYLVNDDGIASCVATLIPVGASTCLPAYSASR